MVKMTNDTSILADFRRILWYSKRSKSKKASVRYIDHGDYATLFVSCGGGVQHTIGMMIDPAKQGTFVLGNYSKDFPEIQDRYTELELPDDYRQRLVDINTYEGRRLHELCEDLLAEVIRNGDTQ